MKNLKVLGVDINGIGKVSYAGLDINAFVPMSVHYNIPDTYCVLQTLEDVLPDSDRIIELSDAEYSDEIAVCRTTYKVTNQFAILQAENEDLKAQVSLMQSALDELILGGVL